MLGALVMLTSVPVMDCTMTQANMNACALAHLNLADAELNNQWKQTIRRVKNLSPREANKLRIEQRAWIRERDTQCDEKFPWDIGVSLDKMLNINCRMDMTIRRTEALKILDRDR